MTGLLRKITLSALALASLNAHAEVDMFLQLDGIRGETRDATYSKEYGIDVLGWSWAAANPPSFEPGIGFSPGKTYFGDLSLTKYIDSSSTALLRLAANGDQIINGTLTLRRPPSATNTKPFIFEELVMSNILVTSVSTGGSGGEDRLTEEISLNFASFCIRYTEQTPLGDTGAKTELCWNIAANQSCTAQQIDNLFSLPLVASLPPNLVHQLTPVCSHS